MIRTHGLTKRFGRVAAVSDLDLDVREGDVYGFLGPNGSGKTTTVRMLLGLVLPTSGTAEVLGRPMPASAAEVLPQVGAMVEGPAAYGQLSGRRNLSLYDAAGRGSRSGRAGRVDDALARVGLSGVDRRPVHAYSLGMRQRLGLAQALLTSPRLLVLDEPTNGLDPQGIRDIRALLLDLNAAGTTVLVSSHLLAEIEQTCGRVGVISRGRLVVQDDLDALRGPTGRQLLRTVGATHGERAAGVLGRAVEERDGERLIVRGEDPAAMVAALVGAGVPVVEVTPERRTLEGVVLDATGAGSDDFSTSDHGREGAA
ncbi:ABC transporter ATP-binding protein [Nocardioides sp. AX2bis]|uniref:ABC transporter ATP-binding protein n=1 Tax=Nocardioides sp. AX2bis TaxID=2653157 RepID=UPI0012EF50F8|nr:ABC transporter ATP-binding protein [Nocardioides sp. AX2bis]VXC40781.1 Multidrug ABC transporer ATPase [Nocardioides sp. AX2bis]